MHQRLQTVVYGAVLAVICSRVLYLGKEVLVPIVFGILQFIGFCAFGLGMMVVYLAISFGFPQESLYFLEVIEKTPL